MSKQHKTQPAKNNILDQLNPDDALAVLKIISQTDTKIAEKIKQAVKTHLAEVDIETVASDVYSDLDTILVEDVWDNAGSTRYGYVDPTELAWEMFEECLASYLDKLKKYHQLNMQTQAKDYCLGILKGIYKFEKESDSEFKGWAEDAPQENFVSILDEWKKQATNKAHIAEVEKFIKENLSDW